VLRLGRLRAGLHSVGCEVRTMRDQAEPLIRRGGCIGDYGNNPKNPAAGGQLSCPSSGSADWGTVFQQVADNLCPKGYAVYWNNHNLGYVGFYHEGNGYQVYLNTTGTCLHQVSG
jgi:hypothetical protein